MGPKRRRITRAIEGHRHARQRRSNSLLLSGIIGGRSVAGGDADVFEFNTGAPQASETATLNVSHPAELDDITAIVGNDNVQTTWVDSETGAFLEAQASADHQAEVTEPQSAGRSSPGWQPDTVDLSRDSDQKYAWDYAFLVSAKPNSEDMSDVAIPVSQNLLSENFNESEISAIPFNEVLDFMLKYGGGYMRDRQYEEMRFFLQASGKGIAQECRTKFSNEASVQAIHLLHRVGILRRQYLTNALSVVTKMTNEEDIENGNTKLNAIQNEVLQDYSLPSLSTLKRRLQPGGNLEHLLLPAIPILLRRKRNVAAVEKQDSYTDSEGDRSGPVRFSEDNNDDESGDVLKAGIILLSSHIKRDMESELTYSCIMRGVRGSEYWEEAIDTDDKTRSFCETDIAMSPPDALAPAAYGFEGVSDTEWPDILREGSTVTITVRGMRNDFAQNSSAPLSSSVHILRGVISGSPQLVTKTPVASERGVSAIDVHPGDYQIDVFIDAACHPVCQFHHDGSTSGVQCMAKLAFRVGTDQRRVTLTTCQRLHIVEKLALSECEDTVPTDRSPRNLNSRFQSPSEHTVPKEGCWVNDKNESCIQIYISIFSDDFRVRSQGTTSAGGVYFLYLSMPLENRSGAQASRVLGVTPPDCDSACLVEALLHDILAAQTEGVLCKDPKGKSVRVFAKLSFYVADYSEIGHTGLIMGHAAQHPCSVCTVSRGEKGTASFHCAKTSSMNLALIRTGSRLDALRTRDTDWTSFGLKTSVMSSCISDAADLTNPILSDTVRPISPAISPLLVLSKGLGEASFDPFLSFVPGPDHGFFLGTGKDTLSLVFSLLPNENARKSLEGIIVKFVKMFGFKRPKKLLCSSPTPDSPLTRLSCSEVAAALSVLPVGMSVFSTSPNSWHRLDSLLLQELVNSVLCLLRSVYSSSLRSDIFTDHELVDLRERLQNSRRLAETVIENVRLCGTSNSARMRVEIEKLRKPNLHRILEFVSRILPMINFEVRHVCELLFEKAHKFALIHFGQTAVGPDEAWNCLRKFRERELCERFHVALQSKSNGGEGGVNTEDRNEISMALRGITQNDVRDDDRLSYIVDNMRRHGSRGLIVQREEQDWVCAKSHIGNVHEALHLVSSDLQTAIVSLNQVLVEEFGSSPELQSEDFNAFSRSKAYSGKTPSPHKKIAVGRY